MAEAPPVEDLLHAVDAAVIATDITGRIFYCNPAAVHLYGYQAADMVGADIMDVLVVPEDEQPAGDIMAALLAGRSWSGEFRVRLPEGTTRWVRLTDSPLIRDGEVVGVIGVGVDASEQRRIRDDAESSALRLTQLSRVTAELAAARDMDAVVEIVVSHAADAVGADIAALTVLSSPETLTLVGLRGGEKGSEARWASFPLDSPVPVAEAVRTGKPVVLAGRKAILERFPTVADEVRDERSMICLPLGDPHRRIGVIGLSFSGVQSPDQQEMEFLTTLADTCGQALERINARGEAETTAAKLSFLARVSEEFGASLDYRTTLANVARLAVPMLADWCDLSIVEDGQLHSLAVAHADPTKIAAVRQLQERYPTDPDAPTGAPNVVRTGRSELYPQITDEILAASTVDAEHLRLALELGLRSGLVVPLTAHGRVLGTLSLVWAESERVYDESDVAFAEEIARRAATAIDNAQLHSETLEAAVLLQRAVLPEAVPTAPGWDIAAHYSPSGRTEVGGDFYDAIPLPDGRLVVVVGDVMGRGVKAAAAMAQMRASVRAFVAIDPDPRAVLTSLDTMFGKFDIAQLVTLLYLVADPSRGELAIVNAGHLPPLLLTGEGTVEAVEADVSLPLGAGPDDRIVTTVDLPRDAILLAFTDGLVERRNEDIDAGLGRLRARAAAGPGESSLTDWLSGLVADMRDGNRDDDVTALAVRTPT